MLLEEAGYPWRAPVIAGGPARDSPHRAWGGGCCGSILLGPPPREDLPRGLVPPEHRRWPAPLMGPAQPPRTRRNAAIPPAPRPVTAGRRHRHRAAVQAKRISAHPHPRLRAVIRLPGRAGCR